MAIEQRKQSRRFFTINDGKFTVRVKSEADAPEGFKVTPRVLTKGANAGKTILEAQTDGSLGGIIESVEFDNDPTFGESTVITFDDGDVLTLKTSGNAGMAFLKMYPNIDITKSVKLNASKSEIDVKGDKATVNNIFIMQNGQPIKWAYTKDKPNGLPQAKVVKVNGQDISDKTEIIEFLKSNIKTSEKKIVTSNSKIDTTDYQADDINPDDIPFK